MSTAHPSKSSHRPVRAGLWVRWGMMAVGLAVSLLSSPQLAHAQWEQSNIPPGFGPPSGPVTPAYGATPWIESSATYGTQADAAGYYQELVPTAFSRAKERRRRRPSLGGFEPSFRVDYMFLDLDRPGDSPIGFDQQELVPGDPFVVDFNGVIVAVPSPPGRITAGDSFDHSGFKFKDVSGVQGTFALPLTTGDLELSAFTTEQSNETQTINTVPKTFEFIGNGAIASPLIGVNTTAIPTIPFEDTRLGVIRRAQPFDTLTLRHTAEFWGANAQFLFPALTPNIPLTIQPLIGGRYFKYRQTFRASGSFLDVSTNPLLPVAFAPRLDSDATNHIFGPTFGFRANLASEYLSLGVEPKFGFGINRRRERVSSSQFFSLTQTSADEEDESDLAPFFELNAYGKLHLNDSFHLFAGYNLFVFTRMSTAANQIQYGFEAGAANIDIASRRDTVVVQGLMVGAEYVFGTRSSGPRRGF